MSDYLPRKFYRYDVKRSAICGRDIDGEYVFCGYYSNELNITEFDLVRTTPKGYWIREHISDMCVGDERWVSAYSAKRYAYPSKAEALDSFVKRTKRRQSILELNIETCKSGLIQAEREKEMGYVR